MAPPSLITLLFGIYFLFNYLITKIDIYKNKNKNDYGGEMNFLCQSCIFLFMQLYLFWQQNEFVFLSEKNWENYNDLNWKGKKLIF